MAVKKGTNLIMCFYFIDHTCWNNRGARAVAFDRKSQSGRHSWVMLVSLGDGATGVTGTELEVLKFFPSRLKKTPLV